MKSFGGEDRDEVIEEIEKIIDQYIAEIESARCLLENTKKRIEAVHVFANSNCYGAYMW